MKRRKSMYQTVMIASLLLCPLLLTNSNYIASAATTNTLASNKIAAVKIINNFKVMNVTRKKAYIDAINQKTSAASLETTKENAIAEEERLITVANNLAATRTASIKKINSFKTMPVSRKKAYADAINKRTSIDSITTTTNNAIAEENRLEKSAKAIIDARSDSLKKISTFTMMNTSRRSAYIDAINKKTTLAAINTTTNNAIAEESRLSTSTAELTEAKTASINKINAFTSMAVTRKKAYIEAINKKTTLAAINVTSTNAANEEARLDNSGSALTAAKAKSTQQINQFVVMPAARKKAYIDAINTKTSIAALDTTTNNAIAEESRLADVESAKESSLRKINAFKTMTASRKKEYVEAINKKITIAALNITTNNAIAEEARLAQKAKEVVAAAEAAKPKANTILDSFANLRDAEKNNYRNQLTKATTTQEVNKVIETARAANKTAGSAESLEKERADAIAIIKKYPELTTVFKNNFSAQVNRGKTIAAIDAASLAAKKQNQYMTDNKESWLKDAQSKSVTQINDSYLTDAQKQTFLKQVQAATDKTVVMKINDQVSAQVEKNKEADRIAAELADAKNAKIENLNSLSELTSTEKATYTKRFTASKSMSELDKLSAEAYSVHDVRWRQKNTIHRFNITVVTPEGKYLIDYPKAAKAGETVSLGFIPPFLYFKGIPAVTAMSIDYYLKENAFTMPLDIPTNQAVYNLTVTAYPKEDKSYFIFNIVDEQGSKIDTRYFTLEPDTHDFDFNNYIDTKQYSVVGSNLLNYTIKGGEILTRTITVKKK